MTDENNGHGDDAQSLDISDFIEDTSLPDGVTRSSDIGPHVTLDSCRAMMFTYLATGEDRELR